MQASPTYSLWYRYYLLLQRINVLSCYTVSSQVEILSAHVAYVYKLLYYSLYTVVLMRQYKLM